VSEVIGKMSFLWLPVRDEPGPNSQRGYIERNVIALLSNDGKEPLDPPSVDGIPICGNTVPLPDGAVTDVSVEATIA
jgi:hypothetical protein